MTTMRNKGRTNTRSAYRQDEQPEGKSFSEDRPFPRKGYAHTIYIERNVGFDVGTGEPVVYWDPPRDSKTNADCYIKFTMMFDYLDRSKENRVSVYAVVQNKVVVRVSQDMPVNLPNNSTLYTLGMVTSINHNRKLDDDRCISTAQKYPSLSADVVRKITRCEKYIAMSQKKIAQCKAELERQETRLAGNYAFLKSLSIEHGLVDDPTEKQIKKNSRVRRRPRNVEKSQEEFQEVQPSVLVEEPAEESNQWQPVVDEQNVPADEEEAAHQAYIEQLKQYDGEVSSEDDDEEEGTA